MGPSKRWEVVGEVGKWMKVTFFLHLLHIFKRTDYCDLRWRHIDFRGKGNLGSENQRMVETTKRNSGSGIMESVNTFYKFQIKGWHFFLLLSAVEIFTSFQYVSLWFSLLSVFGYVKCGFRLMIVPLMHLLVKCLEWISGDNRLNSLPNLNVNKTKCSDETRAQAFRPNEDRWSTDLEISERNISAR